MAKLNSVDPFQKLAHKCTYIQRILSEIYPDLHQFEEFSNLILKPDTGLTGNSRVLFEETDSAQDFFLGVYFSSNIVESFHTEDISLDALSVLAEETSHLLALADTVLAGGQTSLLSLEILGEIDRFLVFFYHFSVVENGPVKLMEIKDLLFAQRSFRSQMSDGELTRYQLAETTALVFLQSALNQHWHSKYLDWQTLIRLSRTPLGVLRHRLLGLGPINSAA
jgi:hypothetical protein